MNGYITFSAQDVAGAKLMAKKSIRTITLKKKKSTSDRIQIKNWNYLNSQSEI